MGIKMSSCKTTAAKSNKTMTLEVPFLGPISCSENNNKGPPPGAFCAADYEKEYGVASATSRRHLRDAEKRGLVVSAGFYPRGRNRIPTKYYFTAEE